MMTEEQKKRIFAQIVAADIGDSDTCFQLRLMFEHEINGMDNDRDDPASLNDQLFKQDFLNIPPPKPFLKLGSSMPPMKAQVDGGVWVAGQKKGDHSSITGKSKLYFEEVKQVTRDIASSLRKKSDQKH